MSLIEQALEKARQDSEEAERNASAAMRAQLSGQYAPMKEMPKPVAEVVPIPKAPAPAPPKIEKIPKAQTNEKQPTPEQLRKALGARPVRREIEIPNVVFYGVLVAVVAAAFYFCWSFVSKVPEQEVTVIPVQTVERPVTIVPVQKASPKRPAPEPIAMKSSIAKVQNQANSFKFTLTGITDIGKDRLAVINNQVVGLGDDLREGAVVVYIGRNTVVLDFQGKQLELSL